MTSQEIAIKPKMEFSNTDGRWAKIVVGYVISKGYFMEIGGDKFVPDEATARG